MSMLLPPFELHEPTTVKEAADLKAQYPDSDWVSGGTDLLPNYKWGLNAKPHVISLARVDEMRELSPTRIGALVTLSQIEKSSVLGEKVGVLSKAAACIASPLIRHSATLGGNLMLDNRCFFFNQTYMWRASKGFCMKADGDACLVVPQKDKCYATFSADLPAPLITLGASLELAGADGTRSVAASDFYEPDGIHRNQKRPDEMVTAVAIPEAAQGLRATYHKLRLRDSFDFPELGIAAAVRTNSDGALERFHLVANALETVPVVLDDLGADHIGARLDEAAIDTIAAAAEDRVRPVKNTNLPPSYRKAMTRVFVKRALVELASVA